MSVPNRIFIVPYRDRDIHKKKFLEHMTKYLKDSNDWVIYFAHQCDNRPFNRGAMKNIGFLAMKRKYPYHYKNITFIFNDVDSYPRIDGMIPYKTNPGIVAHYYGTNFALGGMFAIKGGDFEKTGGFPNFWGWGMEDNLIYERCLQVGLKVDRSCFYPMHDSRIVRLFDGFKRVYSQREVSIYKSEKPDTINDIHNIKYNIENEFINIQNFSTSENWTILDFKQRDIREGTKLKVEKGFIRKNWSMRNIIRK